MGIGSGRRAELDRSNVRNRVALKPYHDVPDVPFLEGRARMLPAGGNWCTATYNWWRAVRIMPHCILWTESDWQYALSAALVHQHVWHYGELKYAGELRQRERAMGCTDEARRGLRIRYVPPEPEQIATITTLATAEAKTTRRVQAFDPSAVGGK